jgi:mono/diheme cytochrome c family protein
MVATNAREGGDLMSAARVSRIGAIGVLVAIALGPALAQSPTDPGRRVYEEANCVGCHKWHGNGGGGYGGDALSLRKTELTRDQIIEVVGCGRPGTGMPFFVRGAYDEVKCHDMNRQDAGAQMPPEGGMFLRPKDIEAVADYVIAHIKGAGEPTYAECAAFFSSTSRVCDVYKTQSQKPDDATASMGKNQ